MSDYRLSRRAERDLAEIAAYSVKHFGAPQARRYAASIVQSIETAASFPRLGRVYRTEDGEGYRRYNVGRHTIFYREDAGSIFIVRILHQAMDTGRHL